MRRKRWLLLLALPLFALFVAIGGEVVKLLWNWLLPTLFGAPEITFWQALGLLALCRILFGGFRLAGGRSRSRVGRRMAERWERMTPEEREALRQRLRGRCGPFGPFEPPDPGPPDPEPTA